MKIYPIYESGKNALLLEAPPIDLQCGIISKDDQTVPRIFSRHPVVDLLYSIETFHLISPMLHRLESLDGFTDLKAKRIRSEICVQALLSIQTNNVSPFKQTLNPATYVDLQRKVGGRRTELAILSTTLVDFQTFVRFVESARERGFIIIRASVFYQRMISRSWHISSESFLNQLHIN